jgi:mannosyltransferase
MDTTTEPITAARGSRLESMSRRLARADVLAPAAIVALAAIVRFATLDRQSFWFDEAVTVDLVSRPFGEMLREIPDSESTPPLYYAVAWIWAQLLGTGEIALRSLSALFGTLTVGVVYLTGTRLVTARVGLVAAAFAAFNPLLVWYSQEARAYALFALLSALTVHFLVRFRLEGTGRPLVLWAVAGGLALLTHYFAIFVLAVEALVLLRLARDRRRLLVPFAGVALVFAAIAPLLLYQQEGARTAWIGEGSMALRVFQTVAHFRHSELDNPYVLIGAVYLLLLTIVLAGRKADRSERRAAGLCATVGFGAIVLPFLVDLAGGDVFFYRNLIGSVPPLVVAAAALIGARRAGRFTAVAATTICAFMLAVDVMLFADSSVQRQDWRSAAAALGAPRADRLVVVSPFEDRVTLRLYRPSARVTGAAAPTAREVVVVGYEKGPNAAIEPGEMQLRGFTLSGIRRVQRITFVRFLATGEDAPVPRARVRGLFEPQDFAILSERRR